MTTNPLRGEGPFARSSSRRATLWMSVAGVTAGWGVYAAVRQLPWQSLVAVFLAAGLLAASLTLSSDAVASDRVDLTRAVRAGLLSGLVVVVAIGLAGTIGALGVALVGLVLVTRPGLLARLHRVRAQRRELAEAKRGESDPDDPATWPEASPEPRDDAGTRPAGSSSAAADPRAAAPVAAPSLDTAPDWSPTLTVPSHLSDEDLCLAWESSGRALRRCRTSGARLTLVRVRQACLDELERRQPDAIRAWVLAAEDAETSPAPYLRR